MTETVRIAYSWCERNQIGEPLEVVRYGSRQWETGNDEDEALAQACSGLETPAIVCPCKITTSGYVYRNHTPECPNRLPAKDYPHRDILSPGPNKSKRNAPNVLSTCAFLVMVEIVAGLIWLVAR